MLNFTIADKKVRLKTEWSEITLKEAIELHSVIMKFPKELLEYYVAITPVKGDTEESYIKKGSEFKFTTEQLIKVFPVHYGKVIKILSGMDIKLLLPADRIVLYKEYLFPIILGLYTGAYAYEVQKIKSFDFENETYFLPKSKEVLGNEQPMSDVMAIQYTETTDLIIAAQEIADGKWDNAGNIVAILCKKEGEEYNEDLALERAKKFQNLPMSIIFEVFFCAIPQLLISKKQDLLYLWGVENQAT